MTLTVLEKKEVKYPEGRKSEKRIIGSVTSEVDTFFLIMPRATDWVRP